MPLSPLQEALRGRAKDLIVLAALLIALIALLLRRLECAQRASSPSNPFGLRSLAWSSSRSSAGGGRGSYPSSRRWPQSRRRSRARLIRLPSLRPVLARHLGRRDPRPHPLGAWALLRLALPLRRASGIRGKARQPAAHQTARRAARMGPPVARPEIHRTRRLDRRCDLRPHPHRQGGRGRTVQDRDHHHLPAGMVLCCLRGLLAPALDGPVQGLLPVRLPAGRALGHRWGVPPERLDRTPHGMRLALPALPREMRLWRDRADRGSQLFRMFPMP